MGRFCYCSSILPGKADQVRDHWKNKRKSAHPHEEEQFWDHLGMTGFESWLQRTSYGDFMVHCLEGKSLGQIFKGLREQIADGNRVALGLQNFYLNVLGKDYALLDAEPQIELLSDIQLTPVYSLMKRAFFFPLLPHKEAAHRRFREEIAKEKRARHEASMKAFGVSRLSTYLQSVGDKKYIVVYTERRMNTPHQSLERLNAGRNSLEWQEISKELMDHTGLSYEELSPDVEWLTQGE